MASRYDAFDNGSPTEDRLKYQSSYVGRSAHDFSCNHAGNLLLGMLGVIDCFDVVPNEDLQMSVGLSVEFRNPTNRPLLNGFRAFVHCRYNRLIDLWEGARNFIDKGRSGNIDLVRPNLIYHVTFTDDETNFKYSVNACTPISLLNMLGLPAEYQQLKAGTSNRVPLRQFQPALDSTDSDDNVDYSKLGESVDFFPADCAFAYQRNWRDFYSNKNLLQNNKFWFPDNEDHFILSYNCENAVAINYESEDFSNNKVDQFNNLSGGFGMDHSTYHTKTPEPNNPVTSIDASHTSYPELYAPNLSGIKFVQFRGDRFTTACPFPDLIRGDIPVAQLNNEEIKRVFVQGDNGDLLPFIPVTSYSAGTTQDVNLNVNNLNGQAVTAKGNGLLSVKTPETSITMSDIYTLETLTAFKRKMGMTNGDYSESIKAQFGVDPRVHDRKGTYVGGFYMDLGTQTIIQTSESGSSPLGTKAGNGFGVMRGEIGSFHVPDFGWIQTYLFVVPDVYYTQGKPRQYSKSLSTELYFPLFNNLPAQAIRNDELFISGTKATDEAPFGYEDRYAEYKGRTNRVSGFMGLSHSVAVYDSAKVMARRFESTPALNSKFVTMIPENVDMEVFTVVDEPPLDFNASISVRRVFPGPYMAIEGSLSSPALN